ncbi:MAG: anaerobic ribonucleoside-triphosphate reductase activating protein [Candidatus Falkowbacteria bacterium]
MLIGGLEKLTLIDYPGKVAAIVFTSGCNFRCQFCYNPMLVWPSKEHESDQSKNTAGHPRNIEQDNNPSLYSEGDLFLFLQNRIGKLDGIVITGGEPTLHRDLPEFIKKIKDLGYAVKLDTNGTNPEMIKELLKAKLVDYLAMDLKAPEDKYELVTGIAVNFQKIKESVKIIEQSGLPYEFRTTILPVLLSAKDVDNMGQLLKGADKWYLQKFKADTELVNPEFKIEDPYSSDDMDELVNIGKKYVKLCAWR